MPSSEVQPLSARSSSGVQESLLPVGRSNSGTARAAAAFAAADLFERQRSSSSSLEQEQVPRDGAALTRLSSGRQGSVAAAGAAGGSNTSNRKGASGLQGSQPVPAAAEGGSSKAADGGSSKRTDGSSSRGADSDSSNIAAEPGREGSAAAPSSSKGSTSSLGSTAGAGNGREAAGAAQAASGASSSSSSPSNTAAAKSSGPNAEHEPSNPELDSQGVTTLARNRPPKDARASIQVQPYSPEARNLVTQAASWAQERSSQVRQQWPPSFCTGQTAQVMHCLHPKSSTRFQRL